VPNELNHWTTQKSVEDAAIKIISLTVSLHRHIVRASSFPFVVSWVVMAVEYVIFKLLSDGSFVRIESVDEILAAKQRLDILSAKAPGDYNLWDSSTHKFVNPFAKSASS